MTITKLRTTIAMLAATFAVAVVPAVSQAAIKSTPTGDPGLDDYCRKAAALIDHAVTQGDLATLAGDDEAAAEWNGLAADMIRRSTANGCKFYTGPARLVGPTRPGVPIGPVQTSPEPTGDRTSPKAPVHRVHASP
jgi:hypothetical protein